jgi:hypothetical protein
LVDPVTNQVGLGFGQEVAFVGHDIVVALGENDAAVKFTFGGIFRDEGRTAFASLQRGFAGLSAPDGVKWATSFCRSPGNPWHPQTQGKEERFHRSLKAKVRALTNRNSQQHPGTVLIRLAQIMRGWANYFKHAVAKHTCSKLDDFTWWRLAHMLRARHRWNWGQLRRQLTTANGRWLIAADGIEYFRIEKVTVTRYLYRGNKIPTPWPPANPA